MGRAQNTENVFSADGLLPPDQKRGHILSAYNERGRVLHGRRYSKENPLLRHTLVHVVYGM